MSHYITRWCSKHGDWDDDVDHTAEACPLCIADGSFKTRGQLERELAAALQRREEDGADAARYRIWRKGTASIVPSCTEQIIDDGLDAALAEARKKATE